MQARGYQEVINFVAESTFGTTPGTPSMRSLPFNSNDLKSDQNLNKSGTINGNRNPTEPFRGNISAGGSMVVPVDVRNFGHWLALMFGAPTTTTSDVSLVNATYKWTASGEGTDEFYLELAAGGNPLLNAPNVVRENDSDMVLGTLGSLAAGEYGYGDNDSLGYQTMYVRLTATGDPDSQAADFVEARYYQHVFKPGDLNPSWTIEDGWSNPAHYSRFTGMKLNSMGMEFGGDGELTASLDLLGASESVATAVLDAATDVHGFTRFNNFQASIKEAGVSVTNVATGSISINNNLDGDVYVIGGGGFRGSIPEGLMDVSGNIRTLFEDQTLYNKAVNGTESSIQLTLANNGYSLDFLFNELQYKREGVDRNGPAGVYVNMPFEAYYDDHADAAAVVATLVNDVASYA